MKGRVGEHESAGTISKFHIRRLSSHITVSAEVNCSAQILASQLGSVWRDEISRMVCLPSCYPKRYDPSESTAG